MRLREWIGIVFLAAVSTTGCCSFEYDDTPNVLSDNLIYEVYGRKKGSRKEEFLGLGFCNGTAGGIQAHTWAIDSEAERPPTGEYRIQVENDEHCGMSEFSERVLDDCNGPFKIIYSVGITTSLASLSAESQKAIVEIMQSEEGSIGIYEPRDGRDKRVATMENISLDDQPVGLSNQEWWRSGPLRHEVATPNAPFMAQLASARGGLFIEHETGTSQVLSEAVRSYLTNDKIHSYLEIWVIHEEDYSIYGRYDPGSTKKWVDGDALPPYWVGHEWHKLVLVYNFEYEVDLRRDVIEGQRRARREE